MSAQTCSGLQIKSYKCLHIGVCVHVHTYTRKHTNTLFHTHFTCICTHAPAHTHIPYTRCVRISECANPGTHSLNPSLTHTSTGPLSPLGPLSISAPPRTLSTNQQIREETVRESKRESLYTYLQHTHKLLGLGAGVLYFSFLFLSASFAVSLPRS